jgi:hypothetical protein
VKKQGNREQEGNLGQSGKDAGKPAGTSGRQPDKTTNDPKPREDMGRNPAGSRGNRSDEDEDSGLGNRATNR